MKYGSEIISLEVPDCIHIGRVIINPDVNAGKLKNDNKCVRSDP